MFLDINLSFDGGWNCAFLMEGGVNSIHLFFTYENYRKGYFFNFLLSSKTIFLTYRGVHRLGVP